VNGPGRRAPSVELEERPHAAVIHVRADIDAAVAPCLRQTLADAVDRHAWVIVDLAEAPTLDSTGLGVLVRAHRRARRRDGTVCFAAPSRYVMTVLHTMHVDGVFPTFDDCSSALQSADAGERPPAVVTAARS
jgi:anti-anti-sigma factor